MNMDRNEWQKIRQTVGKQNFSLFWQIQFSLYSPLTACSNNLCQPFFSLGQSKNIQPLLLLSFPSNCMPDITLLQRSVSQRSFATNQRIIPKSDATPHRRIALSFFPIYWSNIEENKAWYTVGHKETQNIYPNTLERRGKMSWFCRAGQNTGKLCMDLLGDSGGRLEGRTWIKQRGSVGWPGGRSEGHSLSGGQSHSGGRPGP